MAIHHLPSIPSPCITPVETYLRRRDFLKLGAGGLLSAWALSGTAAGEKLVGSRHGAYSVTDAATPFKDATGYGNFLEFASGKTEHVERAKAMKTRPWTVVVDGLVSRPGTYGIDDLLRLAPMEERVYRHRCVEGWSMVIPWLGYPLATLLKLVEPGASARYVEFISHADPEVMPNVRRRLLDWPYSEGLRLDEAMHPLTLMVFGLYGELLPNQSGAPLRLVVPWKYAFKGAKSIVRIRLVERRPETVWMRAVPGEYGFFANVNPLVDHPRWSQARERRIGEFFKRDTLPFNGYADQVGQLYAGMDLRKEF